MALLWSGWWVLVCKGGYGFHKDKETNRFLTNQETHLSWHTLSMVEALAMHTIADDRNVVQQRKGWEKLKERVIKPNIDALVKQNQVSAKVIFCNSREEAISAASLILPYVFEAHVAKVSALRWAMETTLQLSFSFVHFKLDCQKMVN